MQEYASYNTSMTFWMSHPYDFLAGCDADRISQVFVVLRVSQGLEVGSGDGTSAFQVDNLQAFAEEPN